MREVIKIKNGIARMPDWRLKSSIDFVMYENEQLAIIGENGSGKTKFIDMITGRHPVFQDQIFYNFGDNSNKLVSDNIKYITFRDSYGSYDGSYYLQQRWNQQEIDEETPTVGKLLEDIFNYTGKDTLERRVFQDRIYELFSLDIFLDKYIILLSSGELRKFQLAKMLLSEPKILIIDNPFIGLDNETRDLFQNLLNSLILDYGIQLILVISKLKDIPSFITHICEFKNEQLLNKSDISQFIIKNDLTIPIDKDLKNLILSLPEKCNEYRADRIIEMHDVNIRYGSRHIIRNLEWIVKNGDLWALNGKNGAGKSTLLSLICADNPQSYACNITLFDRKRGSGETIWDIKKHIGYISPEMHRAYNKDIECIKIVASGLNDSVGLYVKPTEEEYSACEFWMNIFGIKKLRNRTFMQISSGEQRLVLLARAFVKDPELLILDEPLHGLDERNCRLVKDIIEIFCKRKNKTLIMVSHYVDEYPKCINKTITLTKNI